MANISRLARPVILGQFRSLKRTMLVRPSSPFRLRIQNEEIRYVIPKRSRFIRRNFPQNISQPTLGPHVSPFAVAAMVFKSANPHQWPVRTSRPKFLTDANVSHGFRHDQGKHPAPARGPQRRPARDGTAGPEQRGAPHPAHATEGVRSFLLGSALADGRTHLQGIRERDQELRGGGPAG